MALNFEKNFTIPLADDLAQGRIKGAENFASAIVKYYIDTVKEGMPVGVPPTLPAPGINPTTPPPFTIGVTGVKVNPVKEKAMFNILKAYFMAKDMEVTKGAIKGLEDSITHTVNRLKQKRQEIFDLADQIKQASIEVKNVPNYIKEVVEGAKEIVTEEKAKIKELQNLLANLKEETKSLGVDEEKFQSIFDQELKLINGLKEFKIESFDDFTRVPELIKETKQIILRLQGRSGTASTTDALVKLDGVKLYVVDKLAEIALSFEELSKIILDPPSFINYVEKLAKKNPKVYRLYRGLTKLDAVERNVRPLIRRLEIERDIKKKEIQTYIQPKINAIKQKLEDKVTELSIKKDDSMKSHLYDKVKDRVKEFKENHAESLKERKQELTTIQRAIDKATKLTSKVIALEGQLVDEFEGIKNELILLKQDAEGSVAKYKNLTNEAKQQLADRAKQPLVPTNLEKITPPNPLESPKVSLNNSLDFVQGYEKRIDSTADLERTRELRKNAIKNQQAPGPTPEQVYEYMNEMGLGDFATTVTKIIADSKTDLQTFKRLFETKRNQLASFKLTIQDIVNEIQDLLTMIQEISESKGPIGKKIAWTKGKVSAAGDKLKASGVGRFVSAVGVSLMELFMDIVNYLKPLIQKVKAWATRLFDKVKAYIKNKTAKFEKDIESYLLNLIPLKGYQAQIVREIQDKKKILDAKRVRLEELKEKTKKYQKQLTIIGKIARGSAGLSKNLLKNKNYKFPANEPHINNIVNGIFDLRIEEAGPSVIESLKIEKNNFKEKMERLASIDAMINGFVVLIQGIQQISVEDFKSEMQSFKLSLEQTSSPYVAVWEELTTILSTPVKSPEELSKALLTVVRDVEVFTNIKQALDNTEVVGYLTRLETKLLGKAREILRTYAENPIGKSAEHQEMMAKWVGVLDKKQSVIAFLLTELKDLIDKFFLFFDKEVNLFISKQKKAIKEQLDKWKSNHEVELDKIKERLINVEATFMSVALGLSARAFWTGTTWQGNTGSTHLVLNIGSFKKIKALPQDGMVSMVKEIAQSFENQVRQMSGLVTPPANTGIPPIPFQGYI